MIASERGGEIVTLRTTDAAGTVHETRVWVGRQRWPRLAARRRSHIRLARAAQRRLEGGGRARRHQSATFVAVPMPRERDRINALFAAKYGFADAYIGVLFGRDDATPIRLDPVLIPLARGRGEPNTGQGAWVLCGASNS